VLAGAKIIIAIAEQAAVNQRNKYTVLTADFHFQPITVETLGPLNKSACEFLSQLSGDERETAFIFQHLSIMVQ